VLVVVTHRPTILQIIPRLDAGGAELAVLEMAAAISQAGGRALVLTEPDGRLAPKVIAGGGEILPFPAATKNPVRIMANSSAIERIVRKERVALIHARSRAPAWSAFRAARRTNVPFVTTYHGAYRETNAIKRLYNSVMVRGDLVIANSLFTANLIGSRYQTSPERIEVIHRGIDQRMFDPKRVSSDRVVSLRQRWGVAPHEKVILHAARLTRWKGQRILIDAARRLASTGELGSAVVILAGHAQGRERYVKALEEQIAAQDLRASVRLVGHVDDMPAAYLAATATVIASIEPEAFGRTAAEAAAMGCPVIATDIGAAPEIVLAAPAAGGSATTGWVVPAGDAQALADGLAEALALAPAARLAIGERARARALASFSVEQMQYRTLAVYDRLLGTELAAAFKPHAIEDVSMIGSEGEVEDRLGQALLPAAKGPAHRRHASVAR
jgi:glycosyltransferase involved in cell wall biosynthesis